MDVRGKIAVITGAGSGIGRAAALMLATKGAKIVSADVNLAGAEQTVDLIKKQGGEAVAVSCNVTNPFELQFAIEQAPKQLGGSVDIVFNNAGIGETGFEGDAEERQYLKWKLCVDINLTAVILGTQIAIGEFLRNKKRGVIVNTASMGGILPMIGTSIYAATKAGVIHFTRSLSNLESDGIRVVAVCPSFADTGLTRGQGEAAIEGMKAALGGRILEATEVAKGVCELIERKDLPSCVQRVTVQNGIDYFYLPRKTAPKPKL
eukprot:TRINITY_DN3563_c0_g1_i1.p2 TRINITY_DN3563_c0_g1~~TRINITY_DN3563_c0_g1_i1.p2  ORF type:complete len:263 (+),score=77.85 TRINITY_DN3563_c0_g1_i1:805-1593(+)